jgi:hypothetical protein
MIHGQMGWCNGASFFLMEKTPHGLRSCIKRLVFLHKGPCRLQNGPQLKTTKLDPVHLLPQLRQDPEPQPPKNMPLGLLSTWNAAHTSMILRISTSPKWILWCQLHIAAQSASTSHKSCCHSWPPWMNSAEEHDKPFTGLPPLNPSPTFCHHGVELE